MRMTHDDLIDVDILGDPAAYRAHRVNREAVVTVLAAPDPMQVLVDILRELRRDQLVALEAEARRLIESRSVTP